MTKAPKDFSKTSQRDHDEPLTDYEIGYGGPPKDGQFKPGKSGNPKGKPKRRRKVRTVIEEALDQKIKIRERDRSRSVSKLEGIVMTMVNKALQGDAKAQSNLMGLLRSAGLISEAPEPTNAEPVTAHDDEIIADFLRRRERSTEITPPDDVIDTDTDLTTGARDE
jgi:hypothetical protein